MSQPKIGILALQGAYQAHAERIFSLNAEPLLIRRPEDLHNLDGLILPGGESTTFLRHLERDGLLGVLSSAIKQTPTFGTCAGAILLAREVTHPSQLSLAAIDIAIERNAYGRQNDSVILEAQTELGTEPLEMVFIRAPRIASAGPEVVVLARRGADPVLVRQGHLLAATFHPELSPDLRVHQYFLAMVKAHQPQPAGVSP